MAFYIIPQRYKVRGDTAEVLSSRNEVLLERERCFETDTGRSKIGDGETPWNDLPYVTAGFIDLTDIQEGDVPVWDSYRGLWTTGPGGSGVESIIPSVMTRIALRF